MIVDARNGHRHSYVLAERMRILVIDDDPILREFACVYLSTPDATVTTAPEGNSGLAMLTGEPYDFVLTDLDMPGIDGIEVIRRIRADPATATLPIIVVTGNDDVVSIDRAYEAGATSFITKPINWRLLSYQIRFVYRAHASMLGGDSTC